MTYLLEVTYTYSSTSFASSALTNINNVLAGFPNVNVISATRSGATVTVRADVPDEDAESLRSSIVSAWNTGARTAGKSSMVKVG